MDPGGSGGASGGAASSAAAALKASGPNAGPVAAGESASSAADASAIERARELCRVLQGEPAERRAACCGGRASGHVESSCVRDLSLSLAAGRIALDVAKVESCTLASARALEGCDWVTPSQPVPPAECQGLVIGQVAQGGVCRSSLECVDRLHCEGSSPTQAGRCLPPKPPSAPCASPADGLATYLFARDLEREHPTCAGTCSLLTHRCEASPATSTTASNASASNSAEGGRRGRGSKRPGESCQTDFDCSRGGCSGNPGTCGMKCAVSLADRARFDGASPLSLPAQPSGAARSPERSKTTVP